MVGFRQEVTAPLLSPQLLPPLPQERETREGECFAGPEIWSSSKCCPSGIIQPLPHCHHSLPESVPHLKCHLGFSFLWSTCWGLEAGDELALYGGDVRASPEGGVLVTLTLWFCPLLPPRWRMSSPSRNARKGKARRRP